MKVSVDPEKKIIATIRKSDLAKEAADARVDIYSPGNSLDSKILELDQQLRKIKLSPRAAQEDEEASLMKNLEKMPQNQELNWLVFSRKHKKRKK